MERQKETDMERQWQTETDRDGQRPSVYLSVAAFVRLSIYLAISASACWPASLSVCLSVLSVTVRMLVCLFLSVCLCLCLYHHHHHHHRHYHRHQNHHHHLQHHLPLQATRKMMMFWHSRGDVTQVCISVQISEKRRPTDLINGACRCQQEDTGIGQR